MPELTWLSRLESDPEMIGSRDMLSQHHPALLKMPQKIVILGAAEEGRRLAGLCDRHGIGIAAIVDDSPKQHGAMVGAHRVEASAALDPLDRGTPIVIASHITLNASQRLKERGFQHVAPFAVLQMMHPAVFAPHMFHTGWFEDLRDNRTRYAKLAACLADDHSREVLDAVLAYRHSLVPETLSAVTRPFEVYMAGDLFALADDEIYADAGAYDGDTIRRFIERTDGRFRRAYGFEPDPETFARLSKNFAKEPRVVPVNAGLWGETSTLRFHNNAGRASILGNEGDLTVKVVSLDDYLAGDAVTFLKMNIEGAELEALRGAAQTIRRYKPKLAIAAYHRPSDLWEVANLISEISPTYSLHLRQHRGGVVETVLYGVPR